MCLVAEPIQPPQTGFPCCSLFLVGMLSPTTPAKQIGFVVRISDPYQPSPSQGRVGLRIVSFGAHSVFTHVTACQLADGPKPGVGASIVGLRRSSVQTLAMLGVGGPRSRHEVESAPEVQDEVPSRQLG